MEMHYTAISRKTLSAYTFQDDEKYPCVLKDVCGEHRDLLVLGRDLEAYDLTDDMVRMCLTREMVAALLPLLHHFVAQGSLPVPPQDTEGHRT